MGEGSILWSYICLLDTAPSNFQEIVPPFLKDVILRCFYFKVIT